MGVRDGAQQPVKYNPERPVLEAVPYEQEWIVRKCLKYRAWYDIRIRRLVRSGNSHEELKVIILGEDQRPRGMDTAMQMIDQWLVLSWPQPRRARKESTVVVCAR